MSAENPLLQEHIKKCQEPKNKNKPTFLSRSFLDTALLVISQHMIRKFAEEIKENGGRFGIEMDTTQDVSCIDQCAIAIRYVDSELKIQERTFAIAEAVSTSKYELSVKDITGYSFDGAANMRSEQAGVNHYIKKSNPTSIYTWCFSHQLNLVVKDSTGKPGIKYLLSLAEETASFIRGSHKRMDIWRKVAQSTPGYKSSIRLKLIGKTRWSSKHDAIHNIAKTELHYFVLIKSMIEICCLPLLDGNALVTAVTILNGWLNYNNFLLIILLDEIFSILNKSTKYLQSYGLNMLNAMNSIRNVHEELNFFKIRINESLDKANIYLENLNTLILSDKYIDSVNEDDDARIIPTEGYERYLCENIVLPFVDSLLCGLQNRLINDFDASIFQEISFLDLKNLENILEKGESAKITLKTLCQINGFADESAVIMELCDFTLYFFYSESEKSMESVFHAKGNKESLDTNKVILNENESESNADDDPLISFDENEDQKCCCVQCVLNYFKENKTKIMEFKHVYNLYKYVATLPSTEVKCERTFSNLKNIKNRLRTSLSDNKLESLIIISDEADMFSKIDLNDIIDELAFSSFTMAHTLL